MKEKEVLSKEKLIIPVYINEKIVLDMLAIIEDGFSIVSQVNYTENDETKSLKNINGSMNTSTSFLSKLLKIDLSGNMSHDAKKGKNTNITREKIHTNVSLLSKFRYNLIKNDLLKQEFNFTNIKVGDFIEIEGELQKNPLINYLDIFVDIFNMIKIFTEEPKLGNKTHYKVVKKQDEQLMSQIKSFANELKHSGTIDFIVSDKCGKVVLSLQEQYLENDNVSEIIGGNFKVLGKVIYICEDQSKYIDLLRKTTLSFLSEEMLNELFSGFQELDSNQFSLPTLVTKIPGPAIIVIPVAIYA